MSVEVLVDEPVDLLYRVLPNGGLRPTSFVWRNQTRYVSDLGRTWEERERGATVRCFMIQTVDGNTFEIRFKPADETWRVHRAWLRDMIV